MQSLLGFVLCLTNNFFVLWPLWNEATSTIVYFVTENHHSADLACEQCFLPAQIVLCQGFFGGLKYPIFIRGTVTQTSVKQKSFFFFFKYDNFSSSCHPINLSWDSLRGSWTWHWKPHDNYRAGCRLKILKL